MIGEQRRLLAHQLVRRIQAAQGRQSGDLAAKAFPERGKFELYCPPALQRGVPVALSLRDPAVLDKDRRIVGEIPRDGVQRGGRLGEASLRAEASRQRGGGPGRATGQRGRPPPMLFGLWPV